MTSNQSTGSDSELTMDEHARETYDARTCATLFYYSQPKIESDELTSAGTPWNKHFAHVAYENIESWDDFSEENIDLLFGEELIRDLDNWTNADEFSYLRKRKKKYKIVREADVDILFRECLVPPLVASINFNGNHICKKMSFNSEEEFELEHEGCEISLDKALDDVRQPHKKNPDWPIFVRQSSKKKGAQKTKEDEKQIFVVGEAKRHYVFNPDWLSDPEDYDEERVQNTMGQVGMYAYWGKTRYAYIITSRTLTAFRFYFISIHKGKLVMGAQYKAFDWEKNPRMVPKAIWALAMLSMNEDDRKVVEKHKLEPINKWWDKSNEYCRKQNRRWQKKVEFAKNKARIAKVKAKLKSFNKGKNKGRKDKPKKDKPKTDLLKFIMTGRVEKSAKKKNHRQRGIRNHAY
ncbi:hypothetical protein SCUP234_10490 [Seiridium cupressi]